MAYYRSGSHDRRGYDFFMKSFLGVIVLGLLLLVLYNWKIGLGVFMFGCCTFITLEAVSAPPANNPDFFSNWVRAQGRRRPVLVCLGDSLTHGNCSASITPEIPSKLCQTLGMAPPKYGDVFVDPLWIVNCGQNSITSHTILNERLNKALGCHPDFILLWIGTNDVRAIYKRSWAKEVVRTNHLPQEPTLEQLERNLKNILDFIRQSSPMVQIGICTLPPMGEDLKAPANKVVRAANDIIERVAAAHGERCAVIPVFSRLESILEKTRRSWNTPSVDFFFYISLILNPLFLAIPFLSWNKLSAPFSHKVLSDGLHLNENGRDEVVDLVVTWLMQTNVAKAIAVKS
jgi:lysophospholipase L1-like esterase